MLVIICLTLVSLVYYACLIVPSDPNSIVVPEDATLKYYDDSRIFLAFFFTQNLLYTLVVSK